MDKTRKAILRAPDHELIELRRNWAQYERQADEALKTNAKGFDMKKAVRAAALDQVADYRKKTLELIDAELKRRGLSIDQV